LNNKTELWSQAPASAKYTLPEYCPKCGGRLKAGVVYVGIFPYIHADFTLTCVSNVEHKYNFCMPFNKVMTEGYQIYDSSEQRRFYTENRRCPFHGTPLTPYRYYGDLVFNDGTCKIQLRCPTCFYSERVVFKK
jgi:hypothetical protein